MVRINQDKTFELIFLDGIREREYNIDHRYIRKVKLDTKKIHFDHLKATWVRPITVHDELERLNLVS